jgi:periplasmic divalent cation tolerance protein
MSDVKLVLSTAADVDEGRRIANHLLDKKVAACVNIIPHLESIYLWKGKLEESQEVLLLIKTTADRFADVQREILEVHSYEMPEVLAFDIAQGSEDYLKWVAESVKGK